MRHAPFSGVTIPLLITLSPFARSSSWQLRLKNPKAANSTNNRLPLISPTSTPADSDFAAAADESPSCMVVVTVPRRVVAASLTCRARVAPEAPRWSRSGLCSVVIIGSEYQIVVYSSSSTVFVCFYQRVLAVWVIRKEEYT